MLLGIIAGLTTCALWGLTFVAPRTIAPFTAWDLTIARYGIFGFACLLLMIDRRFRPVGLAPPQLLAGLLLGGGGYVGILSVPLSPWNLPAPPSRRSSSAQCRCSWRSLPTFGTDPHRGKLLPYHWQ
ncbi:hypothetical protein [Rhizobium bangladeshense]|uniref:hypothetical protein n=1 Tax=Rhizobium bangladeshense TaxID=1138189 RepID=UPI002180CDC6|nr:hypothetical protein [Rhizobium bangladeshense]